jgi:hypothetical protein
MKLFHVSTGITEVRPNQRNHNLQASQPRGKDQRSSLCSDRHNEHNFSSLLQMGRGRTSCGLPYQIAAVALSELASVGQIRLAVIAIQ